MARRQRSTESATPATENEESTVTTTDETAPEAATEASTEAAAETQTEAPAAEAEAPIDLTAFNSAVEGAIAQHDNSTGTVPEAAVAPVTEAYRALDGVKPKNTAKKAVEKLMREAMEGMNIGLARAYMVVSDGLTAGASAKQEKAPADPTEALVQRVAGLNLALTLVEVPEGVGEGWQEKADALVAETRDQASAYQAWTNREPVAEGVEDAPEPEAPGWVKAAVKLAAGKTAKVGGSTRSGAASTFTGERRDIGEHIRQAFEGKEAGQFLTIAEIRSFKSTEYPNSDASAGAISARLFPKTGKCTLDFVKPDTNENARKGARKV